VDAKATIRGFVARQFYVPAGEVPGDDESLLDRGIVDSTGVLEVVMFLEETFGVVVEDDEIVPENLDSVAAMAAYVARKGEYEGRHQAADGTVSLPEST